MKNYILILIFTIFLFSCINDEDGLSEGITDFSFYNKSSYEICIEGYRQGSILLEFHLPMGTDTCITESIIGYSSAFDLHAKYDSIRIYFSNTNVSLISTKEWVEARFVDLNNYSMENKSEGHHIATYTFTNADYEYSKQKLSEREARNGGD